MNLRQITYFIAIVEQGSFLKAAKYLKIAQPALSQHIANLEDELGTPLLIRTPRGVHTTSAGEVLLLHARKIAAQLKHAKDDVRLEANTPKGDVALALPPMLSGYLAPRLVNKIGQLYPQIQLRIIEARSLKSYTLVESGRADLGLIASASDTQPKQLHSYQLYQEPLFYVTRAQDDTQIQQLHMKPISFRELSKTPLALSQKQHAVRSILEDISAKKKMPLNIKLETESSSLIRSYTRHGVASSVMPWPSIHHMWKLGEIIARPIIQPDIRRTIFIAWSKNYPLNTAATIVKELMTAEINALYDEGIIIGDKLTDPSDEQPLETS